MRVQDRSTDGRDPLAWLSGTHGIQRAADGGLARAVAVQDAEDGQLPADAGQDVLGDGLDAHEQPAQLRCCRPRLEPCREVRQHKGGQIGAADVVGVKPTK